MNQPAANAAPTLAGSTTERQRRCAPTLVIGFEGSLASLPHFAPLLFLPQVKARCRRRLTSPPRFASFRRHAFLGRLAAPLCVRAQNLRFRGGYARCENTVYGHLSSSYGAKFVINNCFFFLLVERHGPAIVVKPCLDVDGLTSSTTTAFVVSKRGQIKSREALRSAPRALSAGTLQSCRQMASPDPAIAEVSVSCPGCDACTAFFYKLN